MLLPDRLRVPGCQYIFSVCVCVSLKYSLGLRFDGSAITNKSRTHLNKVRRLIFFVEKLFGSVSFGAMGQLLLVVDLDRWTIMSIEVPLDLLLGHKVNTDLGYFLPFLNHLYTGRILFVGGSCVVQARVRRPTKFTGTTTIRHPGLYVVHRSTRPARLFMRGAG